MLYQGHPPVEVIVYSERKYRRPTARPFSVATSAGGFDGSRPLPLGRARLSGVIR
jgi:hypothetical protein